MDENLLGDYLRARRELVRPEDVGLPHGGQRRVPGLRREEVALLAGISSDYYLRLEQGRDRNPSTQVLESLAHVLKLDDAATDYLVDMAALRPRRRRRPRRETVPAGTRHLLDNINLPAFVVGRYLDVLAGNDLATALLPHVRAGENLLRWSFLDPAAKELHADWEESTIMWVAGFRESVGADTDDQRVIELVGELSLGSARFRQLWNRHDVRNPESMTTGIHHPQLGYLTLRKEKLAISGTDGLLLIILHVEPDTADADKLTLLSSLARSTHRTPREPDAESVDL